MLKLSTAICLTLAFGLTQFAIAKTSETSLNSSIGSASGYMTSKTEIEIPVQGLDISETVNGKKVTCLIGYLNSHSIVSISSGKKLTVIKSSRLSQMNLKYEKHHFTISCFKQNGSTTIEDMMTVLQNQFDFYITVPEVKI